jgi:hypothetical protein
MPQSIYTFTLKHSGAQGGGGTRNFDITSEYLFQRFLDPLLPYMVCLDHVFMFFTEYYTSHNRKAPLT